MIQSHAAKKAEWMSYQGDFVTPEGIQKTREFVAYMQPLMETPGGVDDVSMACIGQYNRSVRFLAVYDQQQEQTK